MNIEISPKEYEKSLNWYDAILYCQLLIIDGKNDWRLPSKDELKEIYKSENDLPEDQYYCWSSEEDDDKYAYAVSNRYMFSSLKNINCYVRAVRTI